MRAWRCGRHTLPLDRTLVMGIVNVTPDSFSDGGRFLDAARAIEHGRRLVAEGADLLDVGGESTRPGASPVDAAAEAARVVPVIEALAHEAGVPVSVDTMKVEVARAALDAGASIVNDVTACRHAPAIADLCAERRAGLVLMHMQGEPRTMQADPRYADVVGEVRDFLGERAAFARSRGVAADAIVVDPGIGFGKTLDHNLALVRGLPELAKLGYPVLLGHSRKSFLGKLLDGAPAEARLEGGLAVATLGAAWGASVVRVHDVAPTVRALRVADAVLGRRAE